MIPSMDNQPDHPMKYTFTGEYGKLWISINATKKIRSHGASAPANYHDTCSHAAHPKR